MRAVTNSNKTAQKITWIAVLIGTIFLPTLLYVGIYSHYRLHPYIGLDVETAGAITDLVRRVISAPGPRNPKPNVGNLPRIGLPGPLWVSLYLRGNLLFRQISNKKTLSAAASELLTAVNLSSDIRSLSDVDRQLLRIRLDLSVGQGPIVTSIPVLFAKSIVPGLDGLALRVDPETAYLLPDDLFKQQLLTGYRPFYFIRDLSTGLDIKRATELLIAKLKNTSRQKQQFFRFRVQSFIDNQNDNGALVMERFRIPIYKVTRSSLRKAVFASADFLLRQMQSNGKFRYQYYPLHNKHSEKSYSSTRHAGSAWFFSLAFEKLKAPRFAKAAKTANEYLRDHAVPEGCAKTRHACLGTKTSATLGTAALGTVAMVEYQMATGDARFKDLARRLGEFIIMMQKPNGDFCHQYLPHRRKKDCKSIFLYSSGEAALALAKLYQLTRDPKYIPPIEKALDFLVGEQYGFFLGQFFISEDHWTCIAAEVAFDAVRKKEYVEFCREFAAFGQRMQVQPGPGPLQDLWGSFGITEFFVPHNTPAGSRSEANVATYLLTQKWNQPDPEVLHTTLMGIRYLVDQQIRPEGAYLFPATNMAFGGIMQSPISEEIRIDYVQHAATAMVRAIPLVPSVGWPQLYEDGNFRP
ncbi:MAG: hypothetical protein V1754_02125 [Pseudomonadota bacterium]